jgi:hypothetical protein
MLFTKRVIERIESGTYKRTLKQPVLVLTRVRRPRTITLH